MNECARTDPTPVLLDDVIGHLFGRGLDPGPDATVTSLADGVSARVYLVEGRERWVVKQALPELLVDSQWSASPRRALTEAAALELAYGITPDSVPQVLDVDEATCTLTMTAAPTWWVNWRRALLEMSIEPDSTFAVARRLGRVLGAWHSATWEQADVRGQFNDDETFDKLRVTPFHRSVLRQHPQLGRALNVCIEELETRRDCLVHGDFSPKNVLVSASDAWVLDFEVARVGAAVFDPAFLGHHLAIKALARPSHADSLHRAFEGFLGVYNASFDRSPELKTLGWHTAALMLARVDGVSRAPYLSPTQCSVVRHVAAGSLASTDSSSEPLWNAVLRGAEMET